MKPNARKFSFVSKAYTLLGGGAKYMKLNISLKAQLHDFLLKTTIEKWKRFSVWIMTICLTLTPVLSHSRTLPKTTRPQLSSHLDKSLYSLTNSSVLSQIDRTIYLDRKAINSLVFAESGKKSLETKKQLTSQVPSMMLFVEAYKQLVNPIVNVSGVKKLNNYVKTVNPNDNERNLTYLGDALVNFAPPAGVLWVAGKATIAGIQRKLQDEIDRNEAIYNQNKNLNKIANPLLYTNAKQNYKEQAGKVLLEAHALAQSNDKFRQDFDGIFKDVLGVSILANAQDIMAL